MSENRPEQLDDIISRPDVGIYDNLRLEGARDVRLMRIKTEAKVGICLELKRVTLKDECNHSFVALSYTWGPSTEEEATRGVTNEPSISVDCNGRPLMITANLHAFLLRAASCPAAASRWWWVDAICVNQQDKVERSRQVKLMASIYTTASCVVVWLGVEDQHTARAFQLIRALARCSQDDWKAITPSKLRTGAAGDDPGGNIVHDLRYWESMVCLYHRRYFTRVWIIQEITLAEQRVAVCGSLAIPWDDVVQVSKFLTITSWSRWIGRNSMPTTKKADASTLIHTNANFIEANRRTARSGHHELMLYSLIRGRRFESTDARDKIYALRGVGASAARAQPGFEPLYDSYAVENAYLNAAVQILEDSDDLLLLAHAEGDAFRNYQSLPSWVPDWSVAKAVGLGVTGYARFCASQDIPRFLEIDKSDHSLSVRGLKIDSIVAVGETKGQMLRNEPFPRVLKLLNGISEAYCPPRVTNCAGQPPGEVLWRTLITDTGGIERVHPAPSSFGTAGLLWLNTQLDLTAENIETGLISAARERLRIKQHQQHIDPRAPDEYEATLAHAQHLRPFNTTKAYFGIGSESCQEGDSIFVVAGSRVPLILRRTSSGAFRIVGGAYVHGLMAGEAFDSDDGFGKLKIV